MPWERLWCPFGGPIALEGSDTFSSLRGRLGFLLDRSEYANPKCRFTDEFVLRRGALILCGAPGSGKSAEAWRLESLFRVQQPEAVLLTLTAAHIDGGRALRLKKYPEWKEAERDGCELIVIIDGFDQIRLETGLPISVLARELRGADLSRVRLVITCRASDWIPSAGEELLNLWNQSSTACVFEICPLRRCDVNMATESVGLESSIPFLSELDERNLEAHALWPLTLGSLLAAYKETGQLPSSALEIFEHTVTALLEGSCEGVVFGNKRRRIAERVAALSILCRRRGVAVGQTSSADLLSFDDIRGDAKRALEAVPEVADRFEIDKVLLKNLCESALFVPIQPIDPSVDLQVFGFTHQSIGEFLAASYLRDLSIQQLRQIFTVELAGVIAVPPELSETAAWLAALVNEWFEFLLEHTPEILFRIDGSYLDDSQKKKLAEQALMRMQQDDARAFSEVRRLTPAFAFPGLAELLKTTFANAGAHPMSRRLALQITEECRLTELADDLWELLDKSEHEDLQHWAGSALYDVLRGHRLEDSWIGRLNLMAEGEGDPDDELKGHALTLLIEQDSISPSDLVTYLTPRKDDSFYGSYWAFLAYLLPEKLRTNDLISYLDAAIESMWGSDETSSTRSLLRAILKLTIGQLDKDAEVQRRFVHLVSRTGRQHGILPLGEESRSRETPDGSQIEGRRMLLQIVIDEGDWPDVELFGVLGALACRRPPLGWLLDRIRHAPEGRVPVWARLISYMLGDDSERDGVLDEFLACYHDFEPLRRLLPELRDGLNIHETLIEISKKNAQRRKKRESVITAKNVERPSRRELFDHGFNLYRGNGSDAWIRQSGYLLIDESAQGLAGHTFSIPSSEGWASLSEAEQCECREMARKYLIEHDDPLRSSADWVRTRGSSSGYLAIDLLCDSIKSDSELAGAIGDKWIRSYFREGWNNDDRKKAISKILYELKSNWTRDVFLERLRLENESNSNCQSADPLETCWDPPLSTVLAGFLRSEPDLKPQTCRTAFGILAQHDPQAAKELAKSWLEKVPDALEVEEFQTERAKLFCAGLLTGGELWNMAASFLQPQSLAKQVLFENSWCLRFSKSLTLDQFDGNILRQLYTLFSKLFSRPRVRRSSGSWGDADYIEEFLRALEFAVAKRSTPAELEAVKKALPIERRRTLAYTVPDVLKENASENWVAWKPLAVLRMVQIHDAVFVRNQDDLIEFVIQRLTEFPKDWARNVLPLWRDLEQRGVKKPRSQSEERVSLALAAWLEDAKSLIVNREPQKIATINKRLDIRVQVVVGERMLELIIEIKKASDRRTPTNLQTQLVDDYLIKGKCSHGIYLVVFFGDKKSELGGVSPKQDEKRLAKLKNALTGTSGIRVETMVLDFTDQR